MRDPEAVVNAKAPTKEIALRDCQQGDGNTSPRLKG